MVDAACRQSVTVGCYLWLLLSRVGCQGFGGTIMKLSKIKENKKGSKYNGSLSLTRLSFILIGSYIHCLMRNEITYPFGIDK